MDIALLLQTAGWIGVMAQLGAYALVSRGSLSGASPRYHSSNVFGAALVAASAVALGNWAVAVGQLVWLGLGAAALARAARVRPHRCPFETTISTSLGREQGQPAPLVRAGAPQVCAAAPTE